jgi:hypothetical protein
VGALGEAGQALRPVGLEVDDRPAAIGAELAREAQHDDLALAPLGRGAHHFGDAIKHVWLDVPRHERIAEVMMLLVCLALLLERLRAPPPSPSPRQFASAHPARLLLPLF